MESPVCWSPLSLLYFTISFISLPVTPDRRAFFSLAFSPPSPSYYLLTGSLVLSSSLGDWRQSVVSEHLKNLDFLPPLGLRVFQIAGTKS